MAAPVFRAPLRSRRDDVDHGAAVEWALEHGVVAVGGVLPAAPVSFAEAVREVAHRHGVRLADRLERFASAPVGAFVWTRHPDGDLHLGRVDGPWRYDPSPEAASLDLPHVRAATWLAEPVSPASLPAAVERAFARGGRNFQGTHGPGVEEQTAALWEELS